MSHMYPTSTQRRRSENDLLNYSGNWGGGRAVEGARLLSEYAVLSCIEGSNPSLSASCRGRSSAHLQCDHIPDYTASRTDMCP